MQSCWFPLVWCKDCDAGACTHAHADVHARVCVKAPRAMVCSRMSLSTIVGKKRQRNLPEQN